VQKELQTIIDLALADFKYLNTSEYCKNFSAEAEVQYYLMGHIGNILQVATDRKINLEKHLTANNNIFDPQQYPYMQLRHVEAGEAFGTGMTDLNLGKVQQTLDGLHILAERLRILQNHRLNEKRHARDGELAKDTSIPTLPRAPRAKRPIGLGSSREVAMEEWLEPPAPFIEKLEKLQALTKVNEAVEVFLAINRDHPELANDTQNAYQVIGLMGHIIRSALESGLQPDERIFDENKCLYAKISVLKAAYDFAQKVYDQGDKFAGQDINMAEQKSAGIFTFMTILQKKEHQKKKQARAERDAAIVEKRKAS
ncbi:hypothetical protein HZA40_02260, partial [Candidatus Peregrinibacteria bacterium]|nr:hypothetical protein [Candidatus Peregrinibacteria bacterium]